MSASARGIQRVGLAGAGATVAVVGIAVGAAIVGMPLGTSTETTSVKVPVVTADSPEGQPGHDEICSALRARQEDAMRLHPSDGALARITSQSVIDMNC